jgi:hypothetical protein
MNSDNASRSTEHQFGVNDVFEDTAGDPWEITNRMVDADTGELLYYLQGTDPDEWNHKEGEVVPEDVLDRDSSAWWYVESENKRDGGEE